MNDRFGHEAGDAALCQVAEDMLKWKRRVDTPARIGGEEFALLLPDTDERGAFLVAERLRRATHRSFAEDPLGLTISFGVATYPEHGEDLRALMRAADRALYAAKDLGKDRTAIYSAEVARVLARASGSQGGDLQLAPLMSLAEALDVRDTGNAVHSRTVGRYARLMAVELGLSAERVERVRVAGVLHDVGKIGVSDPVLVKTGPARGGGLEASCGPTPRSARSCCRARSSPTCARGCSPTTSAPTGPAIRSASSGDDIPLEARILAVADAYEAMTRGRVYREALGREAAREELRAGSGSQFDRSVVDAFLASARSRARRGARAARGNCHKVVTKSSAAVRVRCPTEEPRRPARFASRRLSVGTLLATHALKTTDAPFSLRAVRLLDLAVLALALPVFIAAGWPLFAWAGVTRGLAHPARRPGADRAPRPRHHQPAHGMVGLMSVSLHGPDLVPDVRGARDRPDRP